MASIDVTGNQLELEAEVPDDAAFDVVDVVRRNRDEGATNGYQIEVESSNLSFNEAIDAGTAQAVFEHVTDSGWTDDGTVDNLEKLVDRLTKKQLAFVSVLADDGGRVASTPLRKRMDDDFGISLNPRGLGGSIQGLHTKSSDLLGERLTDATWLEEEGEYEYWVQEPYLDALGKAL